MSDIKRSYPHDLVLKDNLLKKKHFTIIISEKENQIKQLNLNLERIKTVEFKKIELQKDTLEREIEEYKQELKRLDAIDVDAE